MSSIVMKRKAIYCELKTHVAPEKKTFSVGIDENYQSQKEGIKRSWRLACQSIVNFQFFRLETRKGKNRNFPMATKETLLLD